MSLIITSSSQGLDETNQIGIARPEQYKNHMRNSLMVEKDSEIAVESVKINRLPMLDAGANMVGNYWFGERLTPAKTLDQSLSYIIPTENLIGRSLAPADFADQYVNTLREAYSLHPEIKSTAIEMNTQVDPTGAFTGYEYVIPQVGAAATNLVPAVGSEVGDPLNLNDDPTEEMTWDGSRLTSQYDDQFGQLLPRAGEGGPIALNGGFLQYNASNRTTFTAGLSRPYCFDVDNNEYATSDHVFKGSAGYGIGPADDQFYDYAVQVGVDDKLRVFHSAPSHLNDAAGGAFAPFPYDQRVSDNGESIIMSEIIYWNNTDTAFNGSNGSNSSFAGTGPITWSASKGVIAFSTSGEQMTISVSGNTISKPIKISASFKGQIPKPIGQTCWKMYPTVGLWDDGDIIDIENYSCRTESTMWNNQPENSWITKTIQPTYLPTNGSSSAIEDYDAYSERNILPDTPAWNNAYWWGHSIDCRDMFRPLQTGPDSGTLMPSYKGIATGVIDSYENIFITGRTERYMDRSIQQWQPNTGFLLGFYPMGFSPLQTALAGGAFGASFVSAQRPSLMSQHSAFIRVPTFTHQTYNFGTGNPSKILFQVPRFDNAGTETGALYYQNNDKTYVDLNNATELRVTDLDVHIVRKNETFVEDLTGSTEIVFHVRKKLK
mgnify:CR=1 FL=1